MKSVRLFLTVVLLGAIVVVSAQAARDGVAAKAAKEARKEAKKLEKAGWGVTPGALKLEMQLERAYAAAMEQGEGLEERYIIAEGMSVGESYDAANMQAAEIAKLNIAGRIQTELTTLVKSKVGNRQERAEEATSIVNSIMAAQSLVMQSLPRLTVLVNAYRVLPNKNREVLVRLACDRALAEEQAKKAVRDYMESQGDALLDEIDEFLKQ